MSDDLEAVRFELRKMGNAALKYYLETISLLNPYPNRTFIIGVALIDADGEVIAMPPPARHHTLIHASRYTIDNPCPMAVQGFLASDYRYVGRSEARAIAIDCGQVNEGELKSDSLFSEDLW